METLTEVPLRTVHAFQTDTETVFEVELPEREPTLTVALDGRLLTVRVPRRDEPGRWHMNADVTGV
ncbi:MAG TPA: hypothetical protein VHH55_00780 [Gaiellaceae bacterium]|jgi:hypothetical protein|nr:hypothetical protein [Gaiellaceae bacterium]